MSHRTATLMFLSCCFRAVAISLLASLTCAGESALAAPASLYSVATIAQSHPKEQTRQYFSSLNATFRDLQAKAGTHADLYLSDSKDINAFATIVSGKPVVVIYNGLLVAYGADTGAVAAVLAHELGHVRRNHVQQGQSADALFSLVAGLAGLAIDANQARKGHGERVGVGAMGAQVGTIVLSRAYSRDQEREADRDSVELLAAAGIDPEAAWRSMEILRRYGGSSQLTIFATHPSTDERLSNLRAQIALIKPQYDDQRRIAEAANRERSEQNRARLDAAEAKAREEALARAEFHEKTERAITETRKHVREEEAVVLGPTARSPLPAGARLKASVEPKSIEQCQALSPTRQTCLGKDADGKAYVKKCERVGEDWKCNQI